MTKEEELDTAIYYCSEAFDKLRNFKNGSEKITYFSMKSLFTYFSILLEFSVRNLKEVENEKKF